MLVYQRVYDRYMIDWSALLLVLSIVFFSLANMTDRTCGGTLLAIDIVEAKGPGMIEISTSCGVNLSPGTFKIKCHQMNYDKLSG